MFDHITFSVTSGAGGDSIYFRMRPEQTAGLMINAFCQRQGISLRAGLRGLKFMCLGKEVDPLLSLQEQEIKDGSVVYVK